MKFKVAIFLYPAVPEWSSWLCAQKLFSIMLRTELNRIELRSAGDVIQASNTKHVLSALSYFSDSQIIQSICRNEVTNSAVLLKNKHKYFCVRRAAIYKALKCFTKLKEHLVYQHFRIFVCYFLLWRHTWQCSKLTSCSIFWNHSCGLRGSYGKPGKAMCKKIILAIHCTLLRPKIFSVLMQ